MSGQKIIDGLREALDGEIARETHIRIWSEGDCPYCQGTGKQLHYEREEEDHHSPDHPEAGGGKMRRKRAPVSLIQKGAT